MNEGKTTMRVRHLAIACVAVIALAGCGTSSRPVAAVAGRSPYPGRDKTWFAMHPKALSEEDAWCRNNGGFMNPTARIQSKNYDPACDAASDEYFKSMIRTE